MIKQITLMITWGLILTIGALTTIYPQHASANQVAGNGGIGGAGGAGGVAGNGGNGIHGGTSGPPGLASATCLNPSVVSHNPNC